MEPRVDQADVSGGFLHNKLQSSPVHNVGAMPSVTLNSSSQSNDPMPLSTDDRSYTLFETDDEVTLPNGHINNESKLSKLSRIKSLRHKTKAKTKKLLKLDHEHDTHESANEEAGEEDGILDNVEGNPAFNPDYLVQKQPKTVGGTADKAVGSIGGAIRSAAAAVAHPRSTAKSKATRTTAGQLSKIERPYLSQEADAEFLRAHDELHRADLSRGNMEDEDAEAKADASKDKVGELENHRESTRVAWITSRHVYRVRVVPNLHLKYPKMSEFETNGPDGTEHHYGKWLGHLVIYYTQDFAGQYIDDFNEPPFDIDSFRYAVERLVMASGPWQEWLMQVRMIYRWENPPKTAKWLVVYLVLWYTQHMMAFFYGYVLYTVVRNYYFPTDIKALRKSIERASDRRGTAYQFGELIDKHGRDEWLQPMIDTIGPFAQLQIGDLANLLEVLYK
ncbi:MAG: hypothetical protein M1835_004689 [Candelina submexicana]|nr:MAG: hypothetical protein M1835_004689 [Candelina submexicana]